MEDLGFDSWQVQEIYLFSIMFRPDVGASHSVCARGSFPGIKRPGHEDDHWCQG